MKSLFTTLILLQYFSSQSQIRWDGEGGDGRWGTPLNWVGDKIPTTGDNVILDNSFLPGNFIVTLPDTSVSILSLTISPLSGNSIQVILPITNTTSSNAFVTTGSVYGLVINEGGVFKNSSGATSGTVLTISDSIRINNGGLFKHNSRTAHALYISILSRTAGTEKGIFEFDVPSPNSYAVSISNRVYGTLVFSAAAAGGIKSYFSSGSNPLTIRGDWHINSGVTYGLDLNDTVFIEGNFIQHPGSKFNAANSTNSAVLFFKKNITIDTLIKTGSGSPQIHIAGKINQNITSTVSSSSPISWFMNNFRGATLLTDLSISSPLKINAGKISIGSGTLTVSDIQNASTDRYIVTNGLGLLKMNVGNNPVIFPVGPDTVSYNPVTISNGGSINYSIRVNTGIHPMIGFPTYGINRTWNIFSASTPVNPVPVTFQYDAADANAGCIPADKMEVLKFVSSAWNIISADIVPAGTDPYLVTTMINSFNTPFAIGRSGGWTLPLQVLHFDALRNDMSIVFKWELSEETYADSRVEIQYSADGFNFSRLATIKARERKASYQYSGHLVDSIRYCRIRVVDGIGNFIFSNIIRIVNDYTNAFITSIKPMPVHDLFTAEIVSPRKQKGRIIITDILGRIITNKEYQLINGNNRISLNCNRLAKGIYHLFCITETTRTNIYRFTKF